MTQFVCFDKTGTLTSERLKIKTMMVDDHVYKFSSKRLRVKDWLNYKSNVNIQIQSNKLVPSDSEDESPESKFNAKSSLRLTLVHSSSIKKKSRSTIAGSDM